MSNLYHLYYSPKMAEQQEGQVFWQSAEEDDGCDPQWTGIVEITAAYRSKAEGDAYAERTGASYLGRGTHCVKSTRPLPVDRMIRTLRF